MKHVETFEKNQNFLADWIVTDDEQLVEEDVEAGLEAFRTRGYDVLAGLATFEGYRLLMADVNVELGARDSDSAALRLCLNKFQMRSTLQEAGLSEVCAYQLGADRHPLCDPGKKWFVKPGKSRLNADLWALLLELCVGHEVEMSWVKGHNGDRENERCDDLAVTAANMTDLPPDPGYLSEQAHVPALDV